MVTNLTSLLFVTVFVQVVAVNNGMRSEKKCELVLTVSLVIVFQSRFTLRVSAQDTNETTDALVFYLQVNR